MPSRSAEFRESDPECAERSPTEIRYLTVFIHTFLIQFQQSITDYNPNACVSNYFSLVMVAVFM